MWEGEDDTIQCLALYTVSCHAVSWDQGKLCSVDVKSLVSKLVSVRDDWDTIGGVCVIAYNGKEEIGKMW
jgi:hypothetical protein